MASQTGSMKISSVDVVERCSLKETDTIIAIIGATGTGKSTFIEAASEHDVGIGHQLEPCTKAIIAYRIRFSSSPETVVLIDTPGYGYASLSDKDVLEILFQWLQDPSTQWVLIRDSAFEGTMIILRGRNTIPPGRNATLLHRILFPPGRDIIPPGRNIIPLSGILYMHRISDNPETCSPLKNFESYRKLCGEDPLRKLILVTTIWDPDGEDFELNNENHLRDGYELRMERFFTGMKAHESAWNILNPLIRANTRRLRIAECLAAETTPSPGHCRSLLLQIANSEEKRQALCTLRNGDAQVMVDYMNLELRKLSISKDKIVGQVCSLLCKFSKSARVFPRSFQVSSIKMSKRPTNTGGFAEVCKGTHRSSGQAVAVKTMLRWELETYRLLLKELSLWAYLSHPNILPFYGVYCYGSKSKSVAVISPWMDNGNLHEYSKGRPQHQKLSLLLDVAKGLLYLHELNIVHGDLKGANILVSKDRKALIADFGISRNVTTATEAKTVNVNTRCQSILADTRRWSAPEMFIPSVIGPISDSSLMGSKPSDIWALGCVVYEIISEKLPYQNFGDRFVIAAITRGVLPDQPHENDEEGDRIPEESVPSRLAKYCWNRDYTQRPTCSDVHTFFTKSFQNAADQSDMQDTTSESSSKFWEDMSKDPNVEISLSHIHFLLREASDSGGRP